MRKVLLFSFVLLFALAACQVQPPPPQAADTSAPVNSNYVLGVVQPFTGSLVPLAQISRRALNWP